MKEENLKKKQLKKLLDLNIGLSEAQELLKVSRNIDKDYEKLKNDYPIQYLIGYVDFYGYKIKVNEHTLIPRYETEYLVEKTINYSKKIFSDKKIKILDLGTGSGCISIALSKNLTSDITAVDISKEALKIAAINGVENRCNINFLQNDMLTNIKEKFDIIISNPPYISKNEKIMDRVYKYEPHQALFADEEGLYFYKNIFKKIKNNLNDRFLIAFEIGETQANELIKIAEEYFINEKIIIEKDLSGKDRYLFIISE